MRGTLHTDRATAMPPPWLRSFCAASWPRAANCIRRRRLINSSSKQAGRRRSRRSRKSIWRACCTNGTSLEAAAQQAQRSVEFSQRGGNAEIVLASYRTLALIKQAQGDTAAAQAALQESIHLAEQPGLSPSAHWHELAYRVLIALLGHDLAACAHLIDQYPPLDQVETLPDYLLLSSTYAQWLLTQGQRAACVEILATRYEKANHAGVLQAHVETRALQALAAATQAEALSFLSEALTLAEPEGYVRTFVDLGEPMRLLIADCRLQIEKQTRAAPDKARFTLLDYANRLLAIFSQLPAPVRQPAISNPQSQSAI